MIRALKLIRTLIRMMITLLTVFPICVSLPVFPHKESRPQRPLGSKLKRSSSVQEIFSSPRNKLLRQSSLQQQKVLNSDEWVTERLTQTNKQETKTWQPRVRIYTQSPSCQRESCDWLSEITVSIIISVIIIRSKPVHCVCVFYLLLFWKTNNSTQVVSKVKTFQSDIKSVVLTLMLVVHCHDNKRVCYCMITSKPCRQVLCVFNLVVVVVAVVCRCCTGVGAAADWTERTHSGHRQAGQQSATPQPRYRGPQSAVTMVTRCVAT